MASQKLISSCVELCESLNNSTELTSYIVRRIPAGHRTVKLEWLRINVQASFNLMITQRFLKSSKDMAPTHLKNQWRLLILQILVPVQTWTKGSKQNVKPIASVSTASKIARLYVQYINMFLYFFYSSIST